MRKCKSIAPEQPVEGAALLLGRPPAAGVALGGGGSAARGGEAGVRSSHSNRAASASPRRSAKPVTFRIRTVRSSATVMTSPGRTSWLAAAIRAPLSRTWPAVTSAAAAVRVRHDARVPQPFVDALRRVGQLQLSFVIDGLRRR